MGNDNEFHSNINKKFEVKIDDEEYAANTFDVNDGVNKKFKLDDNFLKDIPDYTDEELGLTDSTDVVSVKQKKKKGFAVTVIIVLLVLAASAFVSLMCFKAANDVLGMIPQDNSVLVITLPENASTEEVSKILSEQNIVKYPALFKLYVNMRYKNIKYREGQIAIDLSKRAGYDNLISEVKYSVNADVVTVNIPEGFTIQQIADRLEENGVCSAKNFIAAVKLANFDDYDFIKAIKGDTNKYLPLEGYIFPATYEFYVDDNATNVVRKFLDAFDERFTDEMKLRANELGLSVDEIVTLASLVQSESGDSKQMPIIAGIFYNRLNDTSVSVGRLESDVTINYVEQCIKPYVTQAEADEYSLNYNTYKCSGIPAGAVSNPGTEAINAVLYPEDTPYFFFVNDIYGRYYYAETLEQHNENVKLAFSVGEGD